MNMPMCSRCKKNIAVVFITKIEGPDKTTQEFIDLMKKFPDSFFEFLRNLSPRERLTMIDQLAQLNKEDAAKNWKGDNL